MAQVTVFPNMAPVAYFPALGCCQDVFLRLTPSVSSSTIAWFVSLFALSMFQALRDWKEKETWSLSLIPSFFSDCNIAVFRNLNAWNRLASSEVHEHTLALQHPFPGNKKNNGQARHDDHAFLWKAITFLCDH